MVSGRISLRTNAFFSDEEIEVSFPEAWDVNECLMVGHNAPALSDEELRHALHNPIGTERLEVLAKGAREVCILVDDLTKPTPTKQIVPFVLEELHKAGIADDHIRFLCAAGTHRPPVYAEMVAKLGRDIVERFSVYPHSIWENLVYVGKTSRGTPVTVNREFTTCDLRIGIGGLMPHSDAGFGGGGKLVMPGICGIETIEHFHKHSFKNMATGRVDDNEFRLDLEEGARLAGLTFKVDAIVNNRREVVGLFAGDFVMEHRRAAQLARTLYRTDVVQGADVVLANSYPVETQIIRSQWCVNSSLREGGDVVLVRWNSWEGENLHQLSSRFGTDYGGRFWRSDIRHSLLAKAARVFLLTPQLSQYDRIDLDGPSGLIWCKEWSDVLAKLVATHGTTAKVAVYPYAPIQIASIP